MNASPAVRETRISSPVLPPATGAAEPADAEAIGSLARLAVAADAPGDAASAEAFSALVTAGLAAPTARRLIHLTSPLSRLAGSQDADQEAAYRDAESAVLAELESLPDSAGDIAVQLDLAAEFDAIAASLAGTAQAAPWFAADAEPTSVVAGAVALVVRIAEAVPAGTELGFGFRQRDTSADLTPSTLVASALTGALARRIDWIHLPALSEERAEDAPLAAVVLRADTTLVLGILEPGVTAETVERRLAALADAVAVAGVRSIALGEAMIGEPAPLDYAQAAALVRLGDEVTAAH